MALDRKANIQTNIRAMRLLVMNLTRSLDQLERDVKVMGRTPRKSQPSGWPAAIGSLVRAAGVTYARMYSNTYKDGRVRVKLYCVVDLDDAFHVIVKALKGIDCEVFEVGPFGDSITILLSAKQAAKPLPKG